MEWKFVWIGLAAGAAVAFLRVKRGGRTPATPSVFM